MRGHYKLDGRVPVECSFDEACEWMQSEVGNPDLRRVAKTQISPEVWVSTVFLWIDHRFGGDGPPLLFETMIFGGPHDGWQDRYSTWEEAEAGHQAAVEFAQAPESVA